MSGASEDWQRRLRGSIRTLLLALVALGTGCSLTRPKISDCDDNAQCQAAFGYGMVCASGRCERTAPNNRCTVALPHDLLVQPGRYVGWHVYGSLMDRSSATQIGRENAIKLAVTEVNNQAGLEGKGMGVVFCDIAQDADYDNLDRTEAAKASALYLATQIGAPAIVGPSSSPDTLAVYNALDRQNNYGTLIISPAATSTALTGVDTKDATDLNPGLLWRTVPPDSVQGDAIAQYLLKQGHTNVSIVQESGAYGEGLAGVFLPAFEGGGGKDTVHIFSDSVTRDAAILAAGSDPAPEVLFISSQTSNVVAFVKQADASVNYKSKQLFLTDSAANSDLLTQAAGAKAIFPRIRGSRVQIPSGSTYQEFAGDYQAEFNQDPAQLSYVANAYDAAWLVFYGSAWSNFQEGGVSGTGIARGLRQVSAGEPVPIVPSDWFKVLTSFKAGQSIDVAGASSTLDFDPITEEIQVAVEIWAINSTNDGFAVVEKIQP